MRTLRAENDIAGIASLLESDDFAVVDRVLEDLRCSAISGSTGRRGNYGGRL